MRACYEEKTFESYFNNELDKKSSIYFPLGQVQEGVIGADSVAYSKNKQLWRKFGYPWFWFYPPFDGVDFRVIASEMEHFLKKTVENIPNIKVNLLFQYKRAEYLTSPHSLQWSSWRQPYYRYEIYQQQQQLLEHIDGKFGTQVLTLYAAPAVKDTEELVAYKIKNQIIDITNFQKASNLSSHHVNTFIQAGTVSKAFSEPENIKNFNLLEYLSNAELTVSSGENNYKTIINFTSSIASIMKESDLHKESFSMLMKEFENYQSEYKLLYGVMQMKIFKELTGIQWLMAVG